MTAKTVTTTASQVRPTPEGHGVAAPFGVPAPPPRPQRGGAGGHGERPSRQGEPCRGGADGDHDCGTAGGERETRGSGERACHGGGQGASASTAAGMARRSRDGERHTLAVEDGCQFEATAQRLDVVLHGLELEAILVLNP